MADSKKFITTKYGTKIDVTGLSPEQVTKVKSVAESTGKNGSKGAALAKELQSKGKAPTTGTPPGAPPAQGNTPPPEQPRDATAGGATTGTNTTFSQLQEGLKLGKELYPDGSLGRLPNPAPIGAIGPMQTIQQIDPNSAPKIQPFDMGSIPNVGMIDPNSIEKVQGVNPDSIPQVKEISEAADQGMVNSIGQWEDYYTKSQQKDQAIEAALQRASTSAEEGYSSQDMQAKRAMSNREIDNEAATQARDMRKNQGFAGNFGGVAAARQQALGRQAQNAKALTESALLSGEADYKLKANEQAGALGTQAFGLYNQAQQAGLSGLTSARGAVADEALKRQVANQGAQGANQGAYLQGAGINANVGIANQTNSRDIAASNQRAQGDNASNYIQGQSINQQGQIANQGNWSEIQRANQQAQGQQGQLDLSRESKNKDIEAGNQASTTANTQYNMGQNEKEKAGQMGATFGWTQYQDANAMNTRLLALQEQLNKMLAQGPGGP